jgi:hypothetical protein
MVNFFKTIYFWIYIKIHTILINISIALYNTEVEILKADPNDLSERDKHETRKLHRNQLLEKFYAGKTDEKYVREYYEVLKRADKFIRTATPREMALAADRHRTSYGQEDKYGRKYEHFGFYDEKHKHTGKTMGEVLVQEFEERRTKDDDYEILHIFNNKPVEVGFAKVLDVVEKTTKENVDFEYEVQDMFKKSKSFEFPIKIVREDQNAINRIEQLTEFLHVKKIGFEYRQLEFFIPLKFKTTDYGEDTELFKELINIKEVFLRDTYGELIGYGIIKYIKRITHNETHDVLKFEAIEMENVRT